MPQPLPFLCSTLHDEHGGLSWLVERHLPTLLKQVSGLCVSATPKTSSALIEQLRKHGCSVYQLKHDRFAAAYKHIFQLAKRFSKNQTILCCDLDRVLHWMETYPAEWKRMLKTAIQQEYLILERTERAYRTHHEALYHTEPFANAITSRALGEKKRRDYLTSGMSFSPKVFKRLVASFSKLSPDVRILCQIPLVLQSQGIRPTYRPTKD